MSVDYVLGSLWAKARDTLPGRPIPSVAGLVTSQPPAPRWEHCYAASPVLHSYWPLSVITHPRPPGLGLAR